MKNVLLYRMLIVNLVVAMWVAATNFNSSWLTKIYQTDLSQMSYLISVVFVLLMALVIQQSFSINKGVADLDGWITGTGPKRPGELRLERLNPIVQGGGALFVLGLVGTLIGLGLSLEKVDVANLGSAKGIKDISVQLIAGLRTEIGVTVIGSLTGLWIEMNYMFLRYTAAWLAHSEED